MSRRNVQTIASTVTQLCQQCRTDQGRSNRLLLLSTSVTKRSFTTNNRRLEEAQIRAAAPIDFSNRNAIPARILPASPSYFTAAPQFTDDLLLLQSLVRTHEPIPQLPSDQLERVRWKRLSDYRNSTGEKVTSAKYAKLLVLLKRLNRVPKSLRTKQAVKTMQRFQRESLAGAQAAKPATVDEWGRAKGIGRRKEASAQVQLVEGTGEVLVNGRNIVQAFPRLHDRESALWALKITERMDKYNVFALVSGGGLTGQAEAVTLALARALMVHEPALKPALRRGEYRSVPSVLVPLLTSVIAGCVTADARRVERKKPGHVKARKMPTWVKR